MGTTLTANTQTDFIEEETWYYLDDTECRGDSLPSPSQPPASVFHRDGTSVPKATPSKGLRPVAKRVLVQHGAVSSDAKTQAQEVTHEDMQFREVTKKIPEGWYILGTFLFVGIIGLFVYFVCISRK